MQTSQNTTIVKKTKFLLKSRMSFYKILIKINLGMYLALKNVRLQKKKKKKKVKTNRKIMDCFEKANLSVRVNLKSFISTAYFVL